MITFTTKNSFLDEKRTSSSGENGLHFALEYFIAGLVLMITIIGIPFGSQSMKLGMLAPCHPSAQTDNSTLAGSSFTSFTPFRDIIAFVLVTWKRCPCLFFSEH